MHEAKAVRTAIGTAVATRDAALRAGRDAGTAPDPGAWRHLELEILDPTRASPEAVALLAPAMLEEMGIREVAFDVFTRAVRCVMCGQETHAEPSDPVCRACGAPVPRTEGPAIDARWTRAPDPVAATVGVHRGEIGTVLARHERHARRGRPGAFH